MTIIITNYNNICYIIIIIIIIIILRDLSIMIILSVYIYVRSRKYSRQLSKKLNFFSIHNNHIIWTNSYPQGSTSHKLVRKNKQ